MVLSKYVKYIQVAIWFTFLVPRLKWVLLTIYIHYIKMLKFSVWIMKSQFMSNVSYLILGRPSWNVHILRTPVQGHTKCCFQMVMKYNAVYKVTGMVAIIKRWVFENHKHHYTAMVKHTSREYCGHFRMTPSQNNEYI